MTTNNVLTVSRLNFIKNVGSYKRRSNANVFEIPGGQSAFIPFGLWNNDFTPQKIKCNSNTIV
jgi:hypothetical protein